MKASSRETCWGVSSCSTAPVSAAACPTWAASIPVTCSPPSGTGMEAAQVGQAAADTGAVLHELTPQQVSLAEAFMELTRASVDYHGGPLPTQVGPGAAPMGATSMGATSMKLEV